MTIVHAGYQVITIDEEGERKLQIVCLDKDRAHRIGAALKQDSPYIADYILEIVDVV